MGKPSQTLGDWKVERQGESRVTVTLPEGMTVSGDDVTIEDVLTAIANHNAIKAGRIVAKCCSGNMAIAVTVDP